jgi:hypothetical protein
MPSEDEPQRIGGAPKETLQRVAEARREATIVAGEPTK